MIPMTCRNCGAGLSAAADARQPDLLVCDHCGSLHQRAATPAVGPGAVSAGRSTDGTARVPVREVTKPSRFRLERSPGALQVSWRKGRRTGAVVLGAFSLAWLGMAVVSGALPLLIMVPVLGYYALVRGVNRVSFKVSGAGLQVRQGPLPWPGAVQLDSKTVEQLFSVERLTSVRSGSDGRERTQTRRHYRLRARLSDGKRVDVVTGLSSADQALWLEHEAERLLRLEDTPEQGELRRR